MVLGGVIMGELSCAPSWLVDLQGEDLAPNIFILMWALNGGGGGNFTK